jgi:hypothetical protein
MPTSSATDTAARTEATQPATDKPAKSRKRRVRRRVAKGLMWFTLVFTAILVVAEPWLLVPIVATLVALSLWD